jgi:hypothetical protein
MSRRVPNTRSRRGKERLHAEGPINCQVAALTNLASGAVLVIWIGVLALRAARSRAYERPDG